MPTLFLPKWWANQQADNSMAENNSDATQKYKLKKEAFVTIHGK